MNMASSWPPTSIAWARSAGLPEWTYSRMIQGAASMDDMTGDMGGAACVVGLMHALAGRKARVNVVGVAGLVENMPSGTAMRPGDILTAMSGTTTRSR